MKLGIFKFEITWQYTRTKVITVHIAQATMEISELQNHAQQQQIQPAYYECAQDRTTCIQTVFPSIESHNSVTTGFRH